MEFLLSIASRRYENSVKGGRVKGAVDVADWGVRLSSEAPAGSAANWRGEYTTGVLNSSGSAK